MKARILIVDDEDIVLRSCARILAATPTRCRRCWSPGRRLRRIDDGGYDVVVLDIMMPDIDGLQVLQHVKERHPDIDVIMMTGLSQIQTAVRAMKIGAFDYLPKPFDPDELKLVVDRALERQRLLRENRALKSRPGEVPVREHRRRERAHAGGLPPRRPVRPTHCTVLVTGESGTGKEMVARRSTTTACARTSPSWRWTATRCPENLLESELFGHVKGALHRRRRRQAGRVRAGQQRHAVPRRAGQHPPVDAGEAAARDAGARVRPVGDTRIQAPTCGWSRRPTATSRPWWPTAASARTCTTASTCSRSTCRRCASAATTSLPSPSTSSRRSAGSWAGRCRGSPTAR
jgi:FixJ family two-component response regulator